MDSAPLLFYSGITEGDQMNEVISVTEYEEGFALIEDEQGKYLATKDSPDIKEIEFPRCYLTGLYQDRTAMLT